MEGEENEKAKRALRQWWGISISLWGSATSDGRGGQDSSVSCHRSERTGGETNGSTGTWRERRRDRGREREARERKRWKRGRDGERLLACLSFDSNKSSNKYIYIRNSVSSFFHHKMTWIMVWNTSLQDRDAKIVLHSSKHQAADVFQLCYLFPETSPCHLSWNSLAKVRVAKTARELWARSSKQALRLSSEVLGLGTRRQTLWTLFLWAVGMETERQTDSHRQSSISILKPAYGRSKISIHM